MPAHMSAYKGPRATSPCAPARTFQALDLVLIADRFGVEFDKIRFQFPRMIVRRYVFFESAVQVVGIDGHVSILYRFL